MNIFSRVRKPFVLAVLVLTLLLSSAVVPSNNGGGTNEVCAASTYSYSRIYTYYSDASYTTEIGWRYIRCNGTATTSGSTSQYYTSEIVDVCCGNYAC
ncbi:MAG TPA: hypothetical protein VF666_13740 [Pyrinomonadaceae bacterium]|jgi:hypothetical protein